MFLDVVPGPLCHNFSLCSETIFQVNTVSSAVFVVNNLNLNTLLKKIYNK